MTRHADVATSPDVGDAIPALAALADGIGDPQVRNSGTIGGSIANADPAADYPAAIVGLGASVRTDRRTIAGDDFFTGLFETALEEGEIIVSVSFPVPRRAAYAKFPNPASRYAIVGVMAAETASGVRVAVTGAGDRVFRASAMEAALAGSFSAGALAGVSISADGLNEDIHAGRRVSRPSRRGDGAARGRGGGRLTGAKPPAAAVRRPSLRPPPDRPSRRRARCGAGTARFGATGPQVRRKRSQLVPEVQTPGGPDSRMTPLPASVDETVSRLGHGDYVADRSLATAVFLTLRMGRPSSSKAKRGSGRPRLRGFSPGCSGAGSCVSSATRGSTSLPRCTSGTIRDR